MKVDEAMVFSVSLNVASRIHDSLTEPRVLSRDGTLKGFIIDGQLPLKGGYAKCKFLINPNWLEMPPVVSCDEPWVRTGDDWHVSPQTRVMCYIYRRQWLGLIENVIREKGVLAVIQIADLWVVRNCQWLLNKHLLAEQIGLDTWDHSWGFWPHGDADAKLEYERRQNVGGKNNER